MADPLTPEERAAIEAFPPERVTRLPPGATGIVKPRRSRLDRARAEAARRRGAVARLWHMGIRSPVEIARRLHADHRDIEADLSLLKRRGVL